MKKQRILSGIQPSGNLHIGNYLGAIKQWLELQNTYEAFFCVVDEHAITVPQDPKELRENTLNLAMIYLAAGIDPEKSTIFIQSHIPAHAELGWILNTMTPLGELERMAQFIEKSEKLYGARTKAYQRIVEHRMKGPYKFDESQTSAVEQMRDMHERESQGISAGLLNYPTLMAADILLYQTDAVPVGDDQSQHVELTRSLAKRFNNRFGEAFKIPKLLIQKETSRIMGLDDPTKKMSKSAGPNNYIALLDPPDEIRRKIKIAVTDSEKEVKERKFYEERSRHRLMNLLSIYGAFGDFTVSEMEKRTNGKPYGEFKSDLAELLIEKLAPLQNRYHELEKDKPQVLNILRKGADRANKIANATLRDVQEKIGFILAQ